MVNLVPGTSRYPKLLLGSAFLGLAAYKLYKWTRSDSDDEEDEDEDEEATQSTAVGS